jgi:DNA-binding transcriptional MerR regulator
MLTIGQLADCVGVTVRAVRHYHQRGLLPEPDRDASGYRRYDAQAVVDLIRIKTLAEAGVPLARIKELASAPPAQFATAVAQIDKALQRKIRELTLHRQRIAGLAEGGGEQLFLPPEIVHILDQLRGIGVSERTVRLERDGWILMVALSPESVQRWAQEKAAALTDPEFRRLYLVCDEALGWDPADPRLSELARRLASWHARHGPAGSEPGRDPANPVAVALLSSHVATRSPAWRRLGDFSTDQPTAG